VRFDEDGGEIESALTLDDMPTAKLMSTRNCFRNYRAFVNPSDQDFRSIFSCLPFPPRYGGLAFSGCGRLNPLQNDPTLRTIGVGTKLLFNGAEGYVIGTGTRCSPKYPNLMTMADLKGMDPSMMGGFLTAAGPENIATYAVPIPILDEEMLGPLMALDKDIPLSIVDVRDRHKIGQTDYARAWSGEMTVGLEAKNCVHCPSCAAEPVCPTVAVSRVEGSPVIDRSRCVNCGACVLACQHGCFGGSLGSVEAVVDDELRTIPIICRSSNREGAMRAMDELKRRMMDGRFIMTAKVADLRP
jgi:putative methanogenesis marker 16 metalloprotein